MTCNLDQRGMKQGVLRSPKVRCAHSQGGIPDQTASLCRHLPRCLLTGSHLHVTLCPRTCMSLLQLLELITEQKWTRISLNHSHRLLHRERRLGLIPSLATVCVVLNWILYFTWHSKKLPLMPGISVESEEGWAGLWGDRGIRPLSNLEYLKPLR